MLHQSKLQTVGRAPRTACHSHRCKHAKCVATQRSASDRRAQGSLNAHFRAWRKKLIAPNHIVYMLSYSKRPAGTRISTTTHATGANTERAAFNKLISPSGTQTLRSTCSFTHQRYSTRATAGDHCPLHLPQQPPPTWLARPPPQPSTSHNHTHTQASTPRYINVRHASKRLSKRPRDALLVTIYVQKRRPAPSPPTAVTHSGSTQRKLYSLLSAATAPVPPALAR